MRIIGFNGPPRSGKDTLAKHIHIIDSDEFRFDMDTSDFNGKNGAPFDWGHPADIESRACIMPIRKVAFAILNRVYSEAEYEKIKDQPHPEFDGETLRMFMIRLMEEHIKPKYGQNFAVRSMMADLTKSVRLYDNERLLLVTDIGFQVESDYLANLVGPENFFLVKVRRAGTSFTGDSRSYVEAEQSLSYDNRVNPIDGAKFIMQHAHDCYGWEF